MLAGAVAAKDLDDIYSSFWTILLSDPGFGTGRFDEAYAYVKSHNISGFIQEHNNKAFRNISEWDKDYWDEIVSDLMDNFSDERIEHLRQVSEKLYPKEEPEVKTGTIEQRISKRKDHKE